MKKSAAITALLSLLVISFISNYSDVLSQTPKAAEREAAGYSIYRCIGGDRRGNRGGDDESRRT